VTTIAAPDRAGAVLGVDLGAIVANWRSLRRRVAPSACGAVVKADAYGVGAAEVAPALLAAGCRYFFVATLDEGIALRHCLEAANSPPVACEIFVLHGAPAGVAPEVLEARLTPVLNTLADVDAWSARARSREMRVPAALHVDTGMARLGLPSDELSRLGDDPSRLDGFDLRCIMSHLACADTPEHPLNVRQRDGFRAALAILPRAPVSFANSSGIFLGADYWGDLVRPGAALYGVAPVPGQPNPMRGVVRLDGKILQVRQIDSGSTVGYGASHRAVGRERIATVAVGYADGLMRSLGNRGSGYIGAQRVPVVGRVSMDLMTFDVSGVPETLARPGACIELIGPHHPIDAIAAEAGTIGYEILTALGARFARVYTPAGV
jgi:alanine racemase